MILNSFRTYFLLLLILSVRIASAQWLPNPSFEGIPQPHVPPTGWAICTFGNSTPDTQPGNFGIYQPPSHGDTYLGMTARLDGTWEDVHSVLDSPLKMDSCYLFKIDLSFQEIVNFLDMDPITVKIYGHNTTCDKTNMLWQSPSIDNEEWETHEFSIFPSEYDITDIVLEAQYTGTDTYWGYILIDNIRISNEPRVDLGNDTTVAICEDGNLELNAGGGYAAYLWSTGSTDSTALIDSTGTYWVEVMNEYGCVASDTIEVTIEDYVEMESLMIDSTLVCEGQEVLINVQVEYGVDPYSYAWQGFEDTTAYITVVVDSTSYFVVQITDECGSIIYDSIKMIVANGPEFDLGDDMLICPNEAVELNAGSGYNAYLWQDGSQDSVYVATGAGWYFVTVWDYLGCITTDSVFIETYPEIEISLGNDTVLCEVDNITLDAGSDWESYTWFDGTTTQTNTIDSPGSYWVVVEDVNGCLGTDTVDVDLSPAVLVSLGGDTTVCSGDNYSLNPGFNFTSYLWQDGSTGSTIPVVNPGMYWVQVTDVYGCEGVDTVIIGISPSPEVSLGNDTVICTGNSLVLDPGNQFSSYLWQDNSNLPVYTVNSTGLYSVIITNIYNCPASSEVFVEVTSPDLNLGGDTILCLGDTLYLDPGQGYTSYEWQDGQTLSIYPATSEGAYNVLVTDQYNCMSNESIQLTGLAKPVANLGGDKGLCLGDTLKLETINGPYDYAWNGEPGGNEHLVTEGGTYQVVVSNACGSESDLAIVSDLPVPQVYLGEDQVLLEGESIELDAGSGFDQYIWQDGSGGQYFVVSSSTINGDDSNYWVEVWEGPCKSSDTAMIELFHIQVPNVITPNGDGVNDTFTPMEDGWSGVNRHHMEIFNRWGEKIWETDQFDLGWDGKVNGNYVAEGTYFWVLEVYYGTEDVKQLIKGTVTVLGSQ